MVSLSRDELYLRKIAEASGRAAAARSALAQIAEAREKRNFRREERASRQYNCNTVAALQPDGTFRSWAHDALDRYSNKAAIASDKIKNKALARALYSRDIYERRLAEIAEKKELRKQRIEARNKGQYRGPIYDIADKTLNVTGRIVGPVYREAVRPMVSALWSATKEAVKGLWNTGAGAAQVIYESKTQRRNGGQNPSSAQGQAERPRQPKRDAPNYNGQILGPGMGVEGQMYGENLEQRADSVEPVHVENGSSRTETESGRGYIGRLVNIIKNKAYEIQHGIRSSDRKSIDERISASPNNSAGEGQVIECQYCDESDSPVIGCEYYPGDVEERPGDNRNRIPQSRVHDDREFLEQGPESQNILTEDSDNFLREYLTVTGYETQKKINAPFISRRKEREMRDNCSRLSKDFGGDDENMKVAEILRYFHNQP